MTRIVADITMSLDGFVTGPNAGPEHGLEKRLPRITAPTLVVWVTGDRFVSPSYADILQARIPDVRVEMVPEAGHLVGLERPEPYARALRRFGGAG